MRQRCARFLAFSLLVGTVIASAMALGQVERVAAGPTGYRPYAARLVDTRPDQFTFDNLFQQIGRRAAGSTLDVDVLHRGALPASGIAAVVLNVAVVSPGGSGFVTVFPTGETRPNAASLNLRASATASSLVVAKLGVGGRFSVYTSASTHLVVDIVGYFVDTSTEFSALVPARLMDTRPGFETIDGQFAGIGLPAAGSTIDLDVLGRGGVPESGVGAVVVNITAVMPPLSGFVTAWPSGVARPNAASLTTRPWVTTPNLAVVKLGDGDRISLYTSGAFHLVVDVVGWFADDAAGFTPMLPARLADSRVGFTTTDGKCAATGPTFPKHFVTIPVLGRGGVPSSGVSSVVLNLTAVQPAAGGFGVMWANDDYQPASANLNFQAAGNVSNLVVAPVSSDGAVALFTSASSHFVVDVVGYFSGSATDGVDHCDGVFSRAAPSPVVTLLYTVRSMVSDGTYLWTTGNRFVSGSPVGSYMNKIDPSTGQTVDSRTFPKYEQWDIVDIDGSYVYILSSGMLYRVDRATVGAPQLVSSDPFLWSASDIVVTPAEVLIAYGGLSGVDAAIRRVPRAGGVPTAVFAVDPDGHFRLERHGAQVWVGEWGTWYCDESNSLPPGYMFSTLNTTTLDMTDEYYGAALAIDGSAAHVLGPALNAGCGQYGSFVGSYTHATGDPLGERWIDMAVMDGEEGDEIIHVGSSSVVLDRPTIYQSGLPLEVLVVPDDPAEVMSGFRLTNSIVGFGKVGSTAYIATPTGIYAIAG